jgi:hypothetical protein
MAIEENELELDMTAFGEDFEIVDPTDDPIQDKDQDEDSDKDKSSDPVDLKDQEEDVADKDKPDEESSLKGDASSQKLYSSLASALADEGIISSLEDPTKIKTVDDLFGVIKEEIKKNEYSDLTEDQKQYLEAIRTGIPVEEFKQVKSFEQQLEQITDEALKESEDLRKAIIIQDYMNQGIDQVKATKLAQRSIDLNEDLADSLEALASVKTFTKKAFDQRIQDQKQAQLNAVKKEQDELKKIKTTVDDLKEIIPGIKINEKVKNDIFNQMTKTVGQSKDGKPLNALTKARMEDPINFTIKMHYLFNLTNGFKNFDKVVKTSKSQAVKELDDFIKGNTFIPSGAQSQQNMDFDIDDNLKLVLDNL